MNTFCCEIINSLGSVDQMISVDTEELPPAIRAQTGNCTLKSFFFLFVNTGTRNIFMQRCTSFYFLFPVICKYKNMHYKHIF